MYDDQLSWNVGEIYRSQRCRHIKNCTGWGYLTCVNYYCQ